MKYILIPFYMPYIFFLLLKFLLLLFWLQYYSKVWHNNIFKVNHSPTTCSRCLPYHLWLAWKSWGPGTTCWAWRFVRGSHGRKIGYLSPPHCQNSAMLWSCCEECECWSTKSWCLLTRFFIFFFLCLIKNVLWYFLSCFRIKIEALFLKMFLMKRRKKKRGWKIHML